MTRHTRLLALLGAILSLTLVVGCDDDDDDGAPPSAEEEPRVEAEPTPLRELVGDRFEALPGEVDVPRDKMLLGRTLFHDRRLSGDETLSCATCHSLDHGGAEPRRVSTGIRGQQGPINAPTVLNSNYNFRQFWDGRAADLREQAAGPVTNPIEMGGDWEVIMERLRGDAELVARFQQVYPEGGLTQEHVIDAISAYEEYLVTPSPFDRWLGGDDDALTEQQQRGLRSFVDIGCPTCHHGQNLGGDSFQRMGLVNDYFGRRGGEITEADLGRFNVTQDEADRHKFKVPTLRNIELTTPYFHDGSVTELEEAVRTMAWAQLGRELEGDEIADIVAFLHALTGELPTDARVPEPDAPEEVEGDEDVGEAAEGSDTPEEAAAAAE